MATILVRINRHDQSRVAKFSGVQYLIMVAVADLKKFWEFCKSVDLQGILSLRPTWDGPLYLRGENAAQYNLLKEALAKAEVPFAEIKASFLKPQAPAKKQQRSPRREFAKTNSILLEKLATAAVVAIPEEKNKCSGNCAGCTCKNSSADKESAEEFLVKTGSEKNREKHQKPVSQRRRTKLDGLWK